MSNSFAFLD